MLRFFHFLQLIDYQYFKFYVYEIYRRQRGFFSKKLSEAPETVRKIRKKWISGMKRNGLKALK